MSIIPFEKILGKLDKPITGILHCGGYIGDDKDTYDSFGISNVLYVEPVPYLFGLLKEKVGAKNCIQAAVSDKEGEAKFYLGASFDRSNLGCSSLLKMSKLKELHPIEDCGTITVKTTTINKILENRPDINFINIDVQGSEFAAIRGSDLVLSQIDGILTEFSIEPLYEGSCVINDLLWIFDVAGFKESIREYATDYWGDSLFVRKPPFKQTGNIKRI